MEWREKLKQIEDSWNWTAALSLYHDIEADLPYNDRLDLSVSVLFQITDWSLEERLSEQEDQHLISQMNLLYVETMKMFSDNPDYLFSIGVITGMYRYPFGIQEERPKEFVREAIIFAPNILLYKAWYCVEFKEKLALGEDADLRIALDDPFTRQWKENKGMLATYVLGWIQGAYDDKIKFSRNKMS